MPRNIPTDDEFGNIFYELGLEPVAPATAGLKVVSLPQSPVGSISPLSAKPSIVLPLGDSPDNFCLRKFLADQFPLRDGQNGGSTQLSFKIDDRNRFDVYPLFCDITATVPKRENGTFHLELSHPPYDDAVLTLVKQHGGKWVGDGLVERLTLDLKLTDVTLLRNLAKAICKVVNPRHVYRSGQRYDDTNWRWLAERTANALNHFGTVIRQYRKERRAMK